jgi:hypothetical protein
LDPTAPSASPPTPIAAGAGPLQSDIPGIAESGHPVTTAAGAFVRRYGAPLGVYTGSRLLVWLVAAFVGWIRSYPDPSKVSVTDVLGAFDGHWYAAITDHGYPSTIHEVGGEAVQSVHAFFPLYPMLGRAANLTSPWATTTTLIALSIVLGAVATCLLWDTTRELVDDDDAAINAVTLFCFLPGAIILSYAYAEGLLIILALVCLRALHHRRWVLAGVAAGLATATRPNAVVLVACTAWAAVVAWRAGERKALAAPLLAPLGLLAFQGYLWARTGSALTWWRVEHQGWGNHFDGGIGVAHDLVDIVVGPDRSVDLGIVVLSTLSVVGGCILLWKARLPAVYNVFALGILAFAMTSTNLGARPRFVLSAFPLVIAAAATLKRNAMWTVVAVAGGTATFLLLWYGFNLANTPAIVPP